VSQFRYVLERIDAPGAVVRLQGSLDAHSSPELLTVLAAELNDGNRIVIVDMAGLEFIDSSGIATLAEGLTWRRHGGGRFVLTGIRPRIMDVFSLARLDDVFEIAGDCNSVLRDCDPHPGG